MGQLNVDADTHARIHNNEFGAYRGSVLMSPLSRAHLNLSDGTVTSRYSDVMRYEATTKPLLEYIKRTNDWDTLTIQSIPWDAHALAIKNTIWDAHALANKNTTIPHTHLVKLLHKMLPTHAMANKFDGGNRTCPLCGSLHKDFAHILRCQHPSRAQWRHNFLTELRDLHIQTPNTSPHLSTLMLDGIRQWFRSQPCDASTLSLDDSFPTVRTLVRQQNQIGWDQLLMGRFCTEWSRHQQQYFASQHDAHEDLKRRSLTWQSSIIKFCWQQWYTLWRARNQDIHGHDLRTQTEASKRDVRRQLEHIHRNRTM